MERGAWGCRFLYELAWRKELTAITSSKDRVLGPLGVGIVDIDHLRDAPGPVAPGVTISDPDLPPAPQRCANQKDVHHPSGRRPAIQS